MNETAGRMRFNPGPCPRCGGPIPDGERFGEAPGCISRADNVTEVCDRCGQQEAFWMMSGVGPLPPVTERLDMEWLAEQMRRNRNA